MMIKLSSALLLAFFIYGMNYFTRTDPASGRADENRRLRLIFLIGVLLRVIVFAFQRPFNNDPHFFVVQYIFKNHIIPASDQVVMASHPPLYYALAALFFGGGMKILQSFSLMTSAAALFVMYRLIKDADFLRPESKKYGLLFVVLLPQFVMFGNYISNDSLSYLIGALIFYQAYLYIRQPGMRHQSSLAVCLGLGLLTKATFLFFAPPLILLVLGMHFRKRSGLRKAAVSLAVFILIFSVGGSYKYVQNFSRFRRPFISNLDGDPIWARHQKPTYVGLKSLYDVNIAKLCREPTFSESTRYSYPLLMYGTFWYQYFSECNFAGNKTSFRYLGSWIYVFGLAPTLLFFIGALRIVGRMKDMFRRPPPEEASFERTAFESFALLLLLFNVLLVVIAGVRYDVFSCFQSRLLFPSMASFVILLGAGLDDVRESSKLTRAVIYPLLWVLYALLLFYFCVEIYGQLNPDLFSQSR